MSIAEEVADSADFAKTVAPLVREYCQKLDDSMRQMEGLRSLLQQAIELPANIPENRQRQHSNVALLRELMRAETGSVLSFCRTLKKTAQKISQRLEHSEMPELVRLELELRLADLEQSLLKTNAQAMAFQGWVNEIPL